MELIFDKCLREFLDKRGETQRELAEYLSISTQAVSKWCRGENLPDISLLPRIAAFLDVSIDELLGVGEIRKQEKIAEYCKKSVELGNKGLLGECEALWREAYKEFPNDMKVISQLSNAIFCNDGDRHETIELCEKVLKNSSDQSLRDSSLGILSYSYYALGDHDKAREYAEMGSNFWDSKDFLLESILEGDELVKICMENISTCVDRIGYSISALAWTRSAEEDIALREWYLKLFYHLFDNDNCGFYHDRGKIHHHWLANVYARTGDEKKMQENLEAAVHHAECYDSLYGKKGIYTCLVLNGLEYDMTQSTGSSNDDVCSALLKFLIEDALYDKYRDRDWFKALVTRLSRAK